MNRFYTPALFLLFTLLMIGCSKDVFKSYDHRLLGTWRIVDIDRYGFAGRDNLPFSEGAVFTFRDDGGVTFIQDGDTYSGSWDIRRDTKEDKEIKSLFITAVNFADQQVRSEYFNEMVFTNTNRFSAFITYNTRTYRYRFVRQ